MPDKKRRRITCDPVAHKNHLCYLIAHRRIAKAQALVGDGSYRCGICHRRAEDPDNLCDPRPAAPSA